MPLFVPLLILIGLIAYGYWLGRGRSLKATGGSVQALHSLPSYYGSYVAAWCGLPALLLLAAWLMLEQSFIISMVMDSLPEQLKALSEDRKSLLLSDILNTATGNIVSLNPDPAVADAAKMYNSLQHTSSIIMTLLVAIVALAGLVWSFRLVSPTLRARNAVEKIVMVILIVCSTIAILTTVGIVASLLFESFRFFQKISAFDFLLGVTWSPQTAIRADQVATEGSFGVIPLFAGTLLITIIAMIVAVPIGLLSAIYLSDYASNRVRAIGKPILEILAGIPTVVYGFFAALTVAPFIRGLGEHIGLDVASESALAAGLVMGIMIIPFVSSLSDDVINSVPNALREGAFGLGATKSECIKQVVLPAALPGIFAAVLLAASRAIGETMIVVMAAGLAANLTVNPFEAVTTVTVQIVTLLVGDQEFDSAKTLAAFALGLVLFVATLIMNIVALRVVRKYREKYD